MTKRLQITISKALYDALKRKGDALHIDERKAAEIAIIAWAATPVEPPTAIPAALRPASVEAV